MQEVSKEAVFKSLTKKRDEKASRNHRLTLAMMDIGGRRGGATGPLPQPLGLRKIPHFSYVVGFACWAVLALGHGDGWM